MKLILKDTERSGVYRTVSGAHIQTQVIMGEYQADHERPSKDAIDFKQHNVHNASFKLHTFYDALVVEFNNAHIYITTRNNGDAIGVKGWRHVAHEISQMLTNGQSSVPDVKNASVVVPYLGLQRFSYNVLDQIDKLVEIQGIPEYQHNNNHDMQDQEYMPSPAM